MTCGIYSITNIKNKKRYIGSAVDIEKRWRTHRAGLRSGKHHSGHLQAAWNKYGESSFLFEVITTCEVDCLREQEQFWIDAFQTASDKHGYNILPTAGSPLGKKTSDEVKRKLSIALREALGRPELREKFSAIQREILSRPGVREQRAAKMREVWLRPGVKEKRSATSREVRARPEVKAKMLEAQLGRECSEDTRAKISASLLGHKNSEYTRAKLAEGNQQKKARVLAGEDRWNGAKLDIGDVRKIRELLTTGVMPKEIAKMFGVGVDAIRRIKSGKTWNGIN